MKENYHKIMLREIEALEGARPSLVLHSCCAPCSSYVLDYLGEYFDLEILFYNPNIQPEAEFDKRLAEQIRLVADMGMDYRVVGPDYDSKEFFQVVKGYEDLGERSERCNRCIGLRLDLTARYARENKIDYFTSTLTISPMKDAQAINKMGEALEEEYGVRFLHSDFKKNEGFKRSIELSRDYGLYRQDYCGCVFSKKEYGERMEAAHKD